jgi:NhaA family Na+:H+ antiporter
VAFGILPLFALANAGVAISSVGSLADLTHPVLLGIVFGLFIGKPVGIMLFCWIAVKARFAALPERVNWRLVFGVALLCGIGFTMSLFIASLAFGGGHGGGHSDAHGGMERVGILLGTLVSGVVGYVALRLTPGKH